MPSWLLIAIQLAAVASIVAGIVLIYVPAAFIVGGVLLFLVCEAPSLSRPRK